MVLQVYIKQYAATFARVLCTVLKLFVAVGTAVVVARLVSAIVTVIATIFCTTVAGRALFGVPSSDARTAESDRAQESEVSNQHFYTLLAECQYRT